MENIPVPLSFWWTLTVIGIAVFILSLLPLMPNLRYRIQVCLAPFVMALVGVAKSQADGMSLEHMLPMYCATLYVFPLAYAGWRKRLKEMMRDREINGRRDENKMPRSMLFQVVGIMLLTGGTYIWVDFALSH